jgi:hypothetical protein
MAGEDSITRALMGLLASGSSEPSPIPDLRYAWESHGLPGRPVGGEAGVEQLRVAADYLRTLVVTGRSIDAVNDWAATDENASGRDVLLMTDPWPGWLENDTDPESDRDTFPRLTDPERAFVESIAGLVSQIDEFLAETGEDRPNG